MSDTPKTDGAASAGRMRRLVVPLRLIDLDSPWMIGIGRDMTTEERKEAEAHGRHDNPPMSVLGITRDGLAAVDGKEIAQMFVASPLMLEAINYALEHPVTFVDNTVAAMLEAARDAALGHNATMQATSSAPSKLENHKQTDR